MEVKVKQGATEKAKAEAEEQVKTSKKAPAKKSK